MLLNDSKGDHSMMEEEACLPEPVHQPGIKLRSLPSEQPIQMSDNASGDEQSSNDGFHP